MEAMIIQAEETSGCPAQSRDSCGQLSLETSKDGASVTSLGNLFHYLTVLMVEEFILISSPNLSCFNLCSLSVVFPQGTAVKSLAPSS